MSVELTNRLMEAYVDAINECDFDGMREILAPTVVLHSPPNVDRFPGNVIARLRREREALPDLRLEVESSFTDETGSRGVLVVRWMGRRMLSRICLLFEVESGQITSIEPYGGLMKTMLDVGLVKIA